MALQLNPLNWGRGNVPRRQQQSLMPGMMGTGMDRLLEDMFEPNLGFSTEFVPNGTPLWFLFEIG